jgi:RNA-directed DNA polymerase
MAGPKDKGERVEKEEAERRKLAREDARRAARAAREARDQSRRAAHEQRLGRQILHAGEGVSAALTDTTSDVAALERRGLPILRDAADLAELLTIDVRALRWLTYHREVARTTHYRQFDVPKASGGTRTICAPRPALRAAQRAIREKVLGRLEATPQAQGFVRGRSTLTNARPHLRQDVVVKVDITDFFGSIGFKRVRGLFQGLGYSGMVSTLLALLCTEARRVQATIDGVDHWVALGERALPQGAPTSPDLTNVIARRLDVRLAAWARKNGWAYTRYADDLTFSRRGGLPPRPAKADGSASGSPPPGGTPVAADPIPRLLGTVRAVLESEGFAVNPKKTVVARKGGQQRVTGIIVNDQPGIARVELRRFRAAVHRVGKAGFRDPAERSRMLGYASYVKMVKPALGDALLARLREVGA